MFDHAASILEMIANQRIKLVADFLAGLKTSRDKRTSNLSQLCYIIGSYIYNKILRSIYRSPLTCFFLLQKRYACEKQF